MFTNLTLISVISLYCLYAVVLDLSETIKSFVFQTILIYLPLVCIILLISWKRYLVWYKEKRGIKDKNFEDLPRVFRALYTFTESSKNNGRHKENTDRQMANVQAVDVNDDGHLVET